MRAVDTNLLVRLAVRDDIKQTEATEQFIASGAWVSHLVLAETLWVLRQIYGQSPDQIATAVEILLNHNDLTLQDADTVARALAVFRLNPKLGFSDSLILEIARKAGHLPLGTFDRNLGKLDGAHKL